MRVMQVANYVIWGGIFSCVVMLLYVFCYYGWSPERYFTSPLSLVFYYLLPAALIVLLLMSLRMDSNSRIKLSLVLLSIGASIYTMELLLVFSSLMFKEPDETKRRANVAKAFGVDFDARSKREVIADLEKHDVHAVPSIIPARLLKEQADGTLRSDVRLNGAEILPLAGIANTPTVLCNESGKYVIYQSDERGFHNPPGIWDSDHVDIAALGDSFTQGVCVPSERNFMALVRRRYPGTLNLGMVHNGPLAELATLKEYLPSLKPKVVLWFYFEGNDLQDLGREKDSPLMMSYLGNDFSQDLPNRQADIDRALSFYVETWESPGRTVVNRSSMASKIESGASRLWAEVTAVVKLEQLRQHLGLVSVGSYRQEEEVAGDLELFGQILSHAKEVVGTWGGTLCFVYIPEGMRYVHPRVADQHRNRVLALVRNMGIRLIDIHPVFQAQSDPLALFPFGGRDGVAYHYNEAGHQLIAEEVLRSLSLGN